MRSSIAFNAHLAEGPLAGFLDGVRHAEQVEILKQLPSVNAMGYNGSIPRDPP